MIAAILYRILILQISVFATKGHALTHERQQVKEKNENGMVE